MDIVSTDFPEIVAWLSVAAKLHFLFMWRV